MCPADVEVVRGHRSPPAHPSSHLRDGIRQSAKSEDSPTKSRPVRPMRDVITLVSPLAVSGFARRRDGVVPATPRHPFPVAGDKVDDEGRREREQN